MPPFRITILLAGFALMSGCGAAPQIDVARLVQNSAEFSRPKTLRVRRIAPGACAAALATVENWRQLQGIGVIALRQTRLPEGCEAVFTEAVRREIGPAAGEEVPIAVRNFVRITSVSAPRGEAAEAAFEWQWRPNIIGRGLGISAERQAGRATLWRAEDGWRVSRLTLAE